MDDRFTGLIILDGWGLNANTEFNAVAQAHTPTMDRISRQFPYTTLRTSGRTVGLPDGLMGNSEVGHLNLGAGRVVTQAITKIEDSINDGSFETNEALNEAMDRLAGTGGKRRGSRCDHRRAVRERGRPCRCGRDCLGPIDFGDHCN